MSGTFDQIIPVKLPFVGQSKLSKKPQTVIGKGQGLLPAVLTKLCNNLAYWRAIGGDVCYDLRWSGYAGQQEQ